MRVREIMSASFSTIDAQAPLAEAFEATEERNLGALLVMTSGQVAGVITRKDVARFYVGGDEEASHKQIREFMNQRIASCYAETDVREAQRLVSRIRCQHLVVCNREKQVVGLVSVADLKR